MGGMVRSRGRLVVAAAVLLTASTACTSSVQDSGTATTPSPSRTGTTPVTGAALSATAVRAYPGGLVLAAADAGSGAERTTRVLVSRDNGGSFTDITPAGMGTTPALRVDDMVAEGSAHLWLAVWDIDTTKETVYRTDDGGSSWRAAPAPGHDMAAGARDSISFVDAEDGWLVQQMPTAPIGTLYRTGDAGAHWQRVNRRLPQVAPVVADPPTGLWQGGGSFGDRLTHSTDGGHTWTRADLGEQPGRATLFGLPGVFPGQVLETTSSLTGTGEVLRFYRTGDAGATWAQAARLGPLRHEPKAGGGYVRRAQLALVTPSVWWVVADVPRPTVYRTTDAGRHWTTHRLPGGAQDGSGPFVQITASDRRHAWATITGPDTTRVLATTDGGSTWAVEGLHGRTSQHRAGCLAGLVQHRRRIKDGTGRLTIHEIGRSRRVVVAANESDEQFCSWAPFARRLTRAGLRVVLFDYAYGDTYDIRAVLRYEQRHASAMALVGASEGAKAGLVVAARPPARLTALVTLSAEEALQRMDVAPYARRLQVPVLYVTAARDPFGSAEASRHFERIGAEADRHLMVVPGTAHGTALLRSERVDAAVVRFLLRHDHR